MSFVKQLHQRKCLFTRCSDQNQRDLNVSGEGLIHVNTASEQVEGCIWSPYSLFYAVNSLLLFHRSCLYYQVENNLSLLLFQLNVLRNGFEQKIDCARGKYLATSTSADRHASLKSKLLSDCEHMDLHRPPPSAETQEILKLCSRMKRGKRTISHCSTSCSKELSSTNPHHVVLFDLHKGYSTHPCWSLCGILCYSSLRKGGGIFKFSNSLILICYNDIELKHVSHFIRRTNNALDN